MGLCCLVFLKRIRLILCIFEVMRTKNQPDLLALIDHPVKRKILWALTGGRAYTAKELVNNIGESSAEIKNACTALLKSGVVVEENHRHHYFRIADDPMVQKLHRLLWPKMGNRPKPYQQQSLTPLRYCRSCHGHLAGLVGRELTQKMQTQGLFYKQAAGDRYVFVLSSKGESFFRDFGIDILRLKQKGGVFAKACLDFSERKHHLGGKLGVAFLETLKTKGWVERKPNSREHVVTPKGIKALKKEFDLDVNALKKPV